MESAFAEQLLLRYRSPMPSTETISHAELRKLKIDQSFLSALLQVYENPTTVPSHLFDAFSLDTIVDYIQRTHRFYLTKKICEIEQSIRILLEDYNAAHPFLFFLTKFFTDYTKDLTHHIHCEEDELLPYIKIMSATEQGKQSLAQFIEASLQYSLGGFIDAHDDTEGALSHAKKVVDSYAPSNTSITPHRILINQLMNFETDLRIHAFIEEKVLIPRAIALEKKLLTLKNQA